MGMMLYAHDIVLIVDSVEDLQRYLGVLHSFAQGNALSVKLGKTKFMVFNTTSQ